MGHTGCVRKPTKITKPQKKSPWVPYEGDLFSSNNESRKFVNICKTGFAMEHFPVIRVLRGISVFVSTILSDMTDLTVCKADYNQ